MKNEIIATLPEAAAVAVVSPLPPDIQSGVDKLEIAKTELRKVFTAQNQAHSDRASVKRESDSAFAELAEAEATAALDNTTPAPNLRKAAERYQQSLLGHDARIAGLRSREVVAAADVDLAANNLSAALQSWTDEQIDTARNRFDAAVSRFIADAQEPLAIAIALNDHHAIITANNSAIPARLGSGNALDAIRFYRHNQEMTSVIDRYSRIRQTVDAAIRAAGQFSGKQ